MFYVGWGGGDKLAKKATNLAKQRKYYFIKSGNTKYYNTALNPPNVDISYLLDKLNHKHKIERKVRWNVKFIQFNNRNKNNNYNIFPSSERLMYKMIYK